MTLKEYQVQCQRTLVDKGIEMNKAHMIMGVLGEINELMDALREQDLVNIHEEYADEMWYISNLATLYNVDISERKIVFLDELDIVTKLYYLSKLSDLVKRDVIYNKPPDQAQITEIIHIVVEFNIKMFEKKSWDFNRALENNINKLNVRFPEKFTEELANNRNLEAERKELEN